MKDLEKRIYEALTNRNAESEIYAYVVRVKGSPSEDKSFLHVEDALAYRHSLGGRGTLYYFTGSLQEMR